ncbi:hypothetical protein [Alkalihalobacillus sp. AL-G]|uniref:hypothetical protein n=1 Tax=Alkalihalobacillus sp. AL-G TaxID=2926399 RepID=UPI002729C5A8|nr:hypothetical protein [Alkalihalobacillus sp. AL-G]WLD92311.1 hypothetical protein MOJ78_14985 [Alkalihalobacillus sp. AL-G]
MVQIRVLFCFIIILILVTGCLSKEISGTYEGHNENWEIQDVVSVKGEVRSLEITAISKGGFSKDEVPMVVSFEDIVETKTLAQKTDEGVYKAKDANSIEVDIKDEIEVEVIIYPNSVEEQEIIKLSKVE